jgi:hypothetical protein
MGSRQHAIVTSANARCGDFLIHHWLRSLRANVDLRHIDVAVLDYGLHQPQRDALDAQGVLRHLAEPDQHITNVRYRDMAEFLSRRSYQQVLSVDGGDIIFQADISHLFDRDTDTFRAACETYKVPLDELSPRQADFLPETFRMMHDYLADRPTINGGFVLAPAEKFISLWPQFKALTIGFNCYATDQLLLNYVLHRQGFMELDGCYNRCLLMMRSRVRVRDAVFYGEDGKVIPVVHNAGKLELVRCVQDFGYGPGRNRMKHLAPLAIEVACRVINTYKRCRQALLSPRPV